MVRQYIFLAPLTAATALYAVPAFAQTAPTQTVNQAPTTINEVVVTAEKRTAKLTDVAESVTAVSGLQLANQGISGAQDLVKVIPGFSYTQGVSGAPVYTIRGVGSFSENPTAQTSVTVFVDQLPLPYPRMAEGASLDLERIEVLKGPQGTLFGQNATGGVINYIAAKPTNTLHYGFDADYGSYNQFDIGGFVSGPLTDALTARLAVRSETQGDWQTSATRGQGNGAKDFQEARLLLDWRANDKLKFELNLNGWVDRSDTQAIQARGFSASGAIATPAQATALINSSNPTLQATGANILAEMNYPYQTGNNSRLADWVPGHSLQRNDYFLQGGLRSDYDINASMRLVSLTNYAFLGAKDPADLAGTNLLTDFTEQNVRVSTVSQELRLEGSYGDRINYTLGGYYQHDHSVTYNYIALNGSNSVIANTHFDGGNVYADQQIDTRSVFGGADFKLTDALTLQASARYSNNSDKFQGCLQDSGGPNGIRGVDFASFHAAVAPGTCATLSPTLQPGLVKSTLDENNVAWRTSLNWKLTHDTLLYVNVSKGFKAGDYPALPATFSFSEVPVHQESVLGYEAGFKTALFERRLEIQGAGFYYEYTNKQIQDTVAITGFGNVPALINIPKSYVEGAEFDIAARPVSGLTLTAGLTYLNSEVTQGTAFGPVPISRTVPSNVAGEVLPLTPRWQFQSDAEYKFPLTGEWSGFIGGNLSYRSDQAATFVSTGNPFLQIPNVTLLDLRVGAELPGSRLRVELWGKNVTNQQYWIYATKYYDTYSRIYAMPATFGVRVSSRF
ncbi:MAG: TonB-dependent receptor [Caulobacteraceae bacterium]